MWFLPIPSLNLTQITLSNHSFSYMTSQTISHTPSTASQGSQRLPEIPWAQNDGRLVWSLISEMERPENFKVLLGKKDNKEVCLVVYIIFSSTKPNT